MSELSLRRGRITAAESASSYPPYPADWYIEDEEQVPESRDHDLEGEHVRQLSQSPLKYAANGTRELWIFDPKMCRAVKHGKAIRLQVWRRDEEGNFDCVYAGEGPVHSEAIDAWVFVTNEGQRLSIADDAGGTQWWMTCEEQEQKIVLPEHLPTRIAGSASVAPPID